MGILDGIKSLLTPQGGAGDPSVTWLYVRCKRCGTPVAVRVDLRNEPSLDDEREGYILRKEMMDDKCFALMRAEILFDPQHRIVEQTMEGGEFITREEYERSVGPK